MLHHIPDDLYPWLPHSDNLKARSFLLIVSLQVEAACSYRTCISCYYRTVQCCSWEDGPHFERWKLSVSYCKFQFWRECLFGIVRFWFAVVLPRLTTVITNTSDRGTFQCRAKWKGDSRSRSTTFEGGEIGNSAGQVSGACWKHQTLGGWSEPPYCCSSAWCT